MKRKGAIGTKRQVKRHLSKKHIDLKVSAENLALLKKAARFLGHGSINSFVLTTAVTKAYHVTEEHEVILTTERARKSFFAVLENPSPPNAALKSAFRELTIH
jgi:uncharacterized protein (DUF1778 family)